MIINATFWVAVSFFIFFGALIYLKVPQKVNNSLITKINEIWENTKYTGGKWVPFVYKSIQMDDYNPG